MSLSWDGLNDETVEDSFPLSVFVNLTQYKVL